MTIKDLKKLIENKPDQAEVWVGFANQGSVRATGVKDYEEEANSIDATPVLIWGDDCGI